MCYGAHILAGIALGYRRRLELRLLLDSTPPDHSILNLDPTVLLSSGIAALVLDFDGVLAAHGESVPLPEAVAWMKRCETVFGAERIFILSNKPTEERRAWFRHSFPGFRFISSVRKKPFPDGLIKAGDLAGIRSSSVLMVDDRLLTGCLAALMAGVRPCYIRRPYVSYDNRPLTELFFRLVRIGERYFVRIF